MKINVKKKRNTRGESDRHNQYSRSLELVTEEDMPFDYVEAYKSLRTNLKFITATSEAKSFVVTSALGMESKSNTTINLAITLAKEDKKVIVVDGDLRKPVVHRMLGLNAQGKGLSGLLTGELDLGEAIIHVKEHNIDVLPVGALPPNPTELLSQKHMHDLLHVLRKTYDYVLVDTPPVSVVTDAAIIGGMVDGALLVVRSGYAPVEMVQLAKRKLEDVNVQIFGVILARYDPKKVGRQTGYYYSYKGYGYHNKYGYDYGYGNNLSSKKK